MDRIRMRRSTPVSRLPPATRAASHIALALWIGCFGFSQTAHAEVHISGTASDLKVEARSATLEEIFRLLGGSFKFQYRVAGPLDGVVSGTYSGSLPRVVSHLLVGHDFVIRGGPDDLEVIILGGPGAAAAKRVGGAALAAPALGNAGTDPLKECKATINGQVVAVEC